MPSGDGRPQGWLLGICGLHLLLGLLLYDPVLFTGGDNAGYMILGEALGSGRGYRDLYLPDAPLHTKYPPAYPVFLAVLGKMGGLQLFKLASLALTTGAVWLTGRLATRRAGAVVGLAAAFLLALSPTFLEHSHRVLSEAPFLFLLLLSLHGLEEARAANGEVRTGEGPTGETGRSPEEAGKERRRWLLLGLAGAVAAFLTRTAGLPLLVAAALAPALERRGRRALLATATAVLAAGSWALYQRWAAPGTAGYLTELLMVDPYDPGAGRVDPAGLLARTATNLWSYVSDVLPGMLSGTRGVGGTAVAGGVLISALALAGWLAAARRRLGPSELFTFLYLGMIAAWPEVWTDRRFLLPALPLLLLYLLEGGRTLVGTAVRRLGGGAPGGGVGVTGGARESGLALRATVAALAAATALPGALSAARLAPERIRCMAAHRAGRPCLPPAFARFFEVARWAGDRTPPEAVIVNRKPRLFYWISGRRGDVYPYVGDPELVVSAMDRLGTDYVVVDAVSGTTARYLIPAIEWARDRFEVVYAVEPPPTFLLRYRSPPVSASNTVPSP